MIATVPARASGATLHLGAGGAVYDFNQWLEKERVGEVLEGTSACSTEQVMGLLLKSVEE